MPLRIEITVADDQWGDATQWQSLADKCVVAACRHLDLPDPESELSILMTNDAAIQQLNDEWRNKDKPTNVLSFPASAASNGGSLPPLLGDIVLAFETIDNETQISGILFEHHVAHLIVHGFLHLLGYDHENDAEAHEMEAMERVILDDLSIEDPYRD